MDENLHETILMFGYKTNKSRSYNGSIYLRGCQISITKVIITPPLFFPDCSDTEQI